MPTAAPLPAPRHGYWQPREPGIADGHESLSGDNLYYTVRVCQDGVPCKEPKVPAPFSKG